MVSRRSVRVKVMQLLYALNRDPDLSKTDVLRQYDEGVERSFHLFLFTLYVFLQTTFEAVEDKKKKLAKHLPSEEDQLFKSVLFENPLVQNLSDNSLLESRFQKMKFLSKIDSDLYKKLYDEFARTDLYRAYSTVTNEEPDHEQALLELFRVMRKHDLFNEIMEDHFINWQDDKSLAIGAMKKVIKSLPAEERFFDEYYPDDETAVHYGRGLLKEVLNHEADLLELIEPTLKNWDLDRLAIIDMILIKMALAEFLYFPTIPTKVTLNEYVEVSKMYSTPKSKDFVNGILDRLMKSLQDEGKINKEGRGLMN